MRLIVMGQQAFGKEALARIIEAGTDQAWRLINKIKNKCNSAEIDSILIDGAKITGKNNIANRAVLRLDEASRRRRFRDPSAPDRV